MQCAGYMLYSTVAEMGHPFYFQYFQKRPFHSIVISDYEYLILITKIFNWLLLIVKRFDSDFSYPNIKFYHHINRPESTETNADPKCATAGEALRKCRQILHEGIADPEGLASRLYSKNIICRETLDEVGLNNTTRKKNLILLDAIESRLRVNPSDFSKFTAVLSNYRHLCLFAYKLLKCHSELISKQVIIVILAC